MASFTLKRLNGEEVKILSLVFLDLHKSLTLGGRSAGLPRHQTPEIGSETKIMKISRREFNVKQGQASLNAESLSRSTKSIWVNPESISGQIEADPIYISYPINIGSDPTLPIICNSSFLMTNTGVSTIHNVNSNAEHQPPVNWGLLIFHQTNH